MAPSSLIAGVSSAVLALVLASCTESSETVADGLPGGDHLHALQVSDSGQLLLGLHGALWASDDGAAWEQLGLGERDAMALGVAAEGAPLLVGGHDVLARSRDGGETFTELTPSLPSRDIHALAQAPSRPDVAYAFVVGSGIHVSRDAGDTWEEAARVGMDLPADITSLAVDPQDPSIVLVGSGSLGVFRSTDAAASFEQVDPTGTYGMAVGRGGVAVAATVAGVSRSTDGGASWSVTTPLQQFDGQPLAVSIGPDGSVWLATEADRVLYRDDGDGFVEVARA